MKDLCDALPTNLRIRARESENELLFPFPDIVEVIDFATHHGIAVLGLEVFQVEADSLRVLGFSRYEVPYPGDWNEFVESNNAQALQLVQAFPRGEEHGYILSSASEREFRDLDRKETLS